MKKKLLLSILIFVLLFTFGCAKTSAQITINKTKSTIEVGETVKLKIKGAKKKVKWTSSNKSVAKVSKKGKVTGKKKGKATITAKVGKKKFKCKLVVESKNNKKIVLSIDGKVMSVNWSDNSSVKALKKLIKNKPLTIKMSKYGGFEQVGSIGKTLPSNDKDMTTSPGDIVLYSSNQIVVFYGSNSWSYTKLGRILINNSELTELLGNKNTTLKIELK